MQIQISILSGRDIGQRHALNIVAGTPATIGRSDECDVPLWDEVASRRHAALELDGEQLVLVDLGSANGVLVNGQRVRRFALKTGDRIQIGDTELRLETERFQERPTTVLRPDAETESFTVHSSLSPDAVQLGSRIAADPGTRNRLEQLLALVEEVQKAESARDVQGALLDRCRDGLKREGQSLGGAVLVPCTTGSDDPQWDDAARNGAARVSRSVVKRVLADSHALLVTDAARDPRTRERQSIVDRGVSSILAVPLRGRQRIHGVLTVEGGDSTFDDEDLAYAATLARVAGMALESAERLQHSRRLLARREHVRRDEMITGDEGMARALEHLARFAASGGPVLIAGETGTGKELMAQHAHRNGLYKDGPWIPVNCSAIPHDLLESELFGHEKGAFTGATGRREGMFELANQGTLFLDEIGDLPLELQPKLLRVLESGEFFRVGGRSPVRVELLVVSASHRDLEARSAAGSFREDLFFRLNRFRVTAPPLRDRPGDIECISAHFLEASARRSGIPARGLSPAALDALRHYDWPGNVRELRNMIERAVVIATGSEISPGDLAFGPAGSRAGTEHQGASADPPLSLDQVEEAAIRAALRHTGGVKGEAATLLGIAWPTLRRKLRKYQIDPERP